MDSQHTRWLPSMSSGKFSYVGDIFGNKGLIARTHVFLHMFCLKVFTTALVLSQTNLFSIEHQCGHVIFILMFSGVLSVICHNFCPICYSQIHFKVDQTRYRCIMIFISILVGKEFWIDITMMSTVDVNCRHQVDNCWHQIDVPHWLFF